MSIIYFIKQILNWEEPEKAKLTNEWKPAQPTTIAGNYIKECGLCVSSLDLHELFWYVNGFWYINVQVQKYSGGNRTFPNIPTISLLVHIVVCKDIRNMISLCFTHTDMLCWYIKHWNREKFILKGTSGGHLSKPCSKNVLKLKQAHNLFFPWYPA